MNPSPAFKHVDQYLQQLEIVVRNLPRKELAQVVDLLLDAHKRKAMIFVIGNGGSAATASHMGNDLNKLTITPDLPRLRVLALTDNVPLITAWGNDNGFETVFVEQLKHFMQADDIVIGVTTSGNSPNIVEAFAYAKANGATTVLLGGEQGGKCLPHTDLCVLTPTDHQGMQEDCHLIFNHVVANTIRDMLRTSVANNSG